MPSGGGPDAVPRHMKARLLQPGSERPRTPLLQALALAGPPRRRQVLTPPVRRLLAAPRFVPARTGARWTSQETQTGASLHRPVRTVHPPRPVPPLPRRRSRRTAPLTDHREPRTPTAPDDRPLPPHPATPARAGRPAHDEPLTAAPAPQSLGRRPWTRRPFGMLTAFIERVPTPSSAPPRPWDAPPRALTQPAPAPDRSRTGRAEPRRRRGVGGDRRRPAAAPVGYRRLPGR